MKNLSAKKEVIGAFDEVLAFERGQKDLRTATAFLAAPPPAWSGSEITKLRKEGLHVSQTVFASLLAVSPGIIRAWKQGLKQPSKMACPMMELVENDPKVLSKLAPKKSARDKKSRQAA